MPGARIPVLESEKFTISNDGRGLIVFDDGTNFKSGGAWSAAVDSGATFACLPLASCNAWMRVTFMSGSAGSLGYGYIPILSSRFGQD